MLVRPNFLFAITINLITAMDPRLQAEPHAPEERESHVSGDKLMEAFNLWAVKEEVEF